MGLKEVQRGTEKLLPFGFGCFVDSGKAACSLCVLLLTATWLGSSICDVTAWGSNRSRTGIVYRNVFWNYCTTMPQNRLAGWHVTVLQSKMVVLAEDWLLRLLWH